MPYYIINKNEDNNGYNEVHDISCEHKPHIQNQYSLGSHSDPKSAVAFAKNTGWINADGCYYCCEEAHRG